MDGSIHEEECAVWYLFGRDERGEFVDCCASHRLTENSPLRPRCGACPEDLPTIIEMRRVSPDPDEAVPAPPWPHHDSGGPDRVDA